LNLKDFIYSYSKEFSGSRLKYLASYLKEENITTEMFLDLVNKEYYKEFSVLYSNRNTQNIDKTLNKINWSLIKYKIENVYDIGAGEGFINKLLINQKIKYKHFYNCDPYQKPKIEDERSFHLKLNFASTISEIKKSKTKNLITLCSTVHHMINPNNSLSKLLECLKKEDYILIGHEPLNSKYSTFCHIVLKLFFLISNFNNKKKVNYSRINKFKTVSNKLKKNRIIKNNISPLEIRRLVDYQVGYKLDYLKLNIPKKYNEGYWSVSNTLKLLEKNNLEIIEFIKYPYLSTEFKKFKGFLDFLSYIFRLNTNYTILARKK